MKYQGIKGKGSIVLNISNLEKQNNQNFLTFLIKKVVLSNFSKKFLTNDNRMFKEKESVERLKKVENRQMKYMVFDSKINSKI